MVAVSAGCCLLLSGVAELSALIGTWAVVRVIAEPWLPSSR
jgi:hypothetical protein